MKKYQYSGKLCFDYLTQQQLSNIFLISQKHTLLPIITSDPMQKQFLRPNSSGLDQIYKEHILF
jgi:hypothetical protein